MIVITDRDLRFAGRDPSPSTHIITDDQVQPWATRDQPRVFALCGTRMIPTWVGMNAVRGDICARCRAAIDDSDVQDMDTPSY